MNDLTPAWRQKFLTAFTFTALLAHCLDAFAYTDDQLFCYQKFATADYRNAIEHCRVAAIRGDAEAQFKLATLYATGKGVAKDLIDSIEWLERATDQGHLEASYNLAFVLDKGIGVAPDLPRAAKLYRSAAERGHLKSQHNLALLYQAGRGVEKDRQQAYEWHLKSAEDGFLHGQLRVGVMLMVGQGTTQNKSEGIKYLRRAAVRGEPEAQFFLARALIEEQPDVAGEWFELAIDQGHTMAMHQYAKYLAMESSDSADHARAADLADRAVKAGSLESVRLIADIDEKIAKAEALRATPDDFVAQPELQTKSSLPQYTIQVISLSTMPSVTTFIKKHELKDAHIHPTETNGQTIYVVTLGKFAKQSDAIAAKQALPEDLQKLKPLIREKTF